MTSFLYNLETSLRLALATDRYVAYRSEDLYLIHDRETGNAIDYSKPVFPKTSRSKNVLGWDGGGIAERKAAALNKAAAKAAAAAPQVAPVAEVVVEVAPVVEATSYSPLHPETAPGAGGELVTLAQLEENSGMLEASASGAQGGWVTVYLADRQGIDVGGAQFAVVCEHHGNIGAAADIPVATKLLRRPALFCLDCAAHQCSQLQVGAPLEAWQRRTLLEMALIQPNPLLEHELEELTDAELVTAAGFQPMLPALLQTPLPQGKAVLRHFVGRKPR